MAIPRNLANIAPHVNASSTELVVNDGGANLDFRVEGDTDANLLFVDASTDRVGIGTATPVCRLEASVASTDATLKVEVLRISRTGGGPSGVGVPNREAFLTFFDSANGTITAGISGLRDDPATFRGSLLFYTYPAPGGTAGGVTNLVERARIVEDGSFLFGTTSSPATSGGGSGFINDGENRWQLIQNQNTTDPRALQIFRNPNGAIGSIQTSGSATSFNTSSDYRLKNTIAPMTGALAKVALLKPCTYKWNCDGSDSQGFIAHELAEVVPQCVSGDKDAVNEDGSIKPQGVDTSFLVATLTAAIQELKVELDQAKTRIAALEVQ